MDKTTTIYTLKAFDLQLGIMPGFKQLEKALKDLKARLPQKIHEPIALATKVEELKAWAEKNKFGDAQDAYSKWAKSAVEKVEKMNDNEFEVRRGRDNSSREITLFGSKSTVPAHARELIKGSKLEEILTNGPGKDFGSWLDLNTVINTVSTAIKSIIPENERPKRAKKGETSAAAPAA